MQLVVTLVGQLEGTIELNGENGTAFVISFSVDMCVKDNVDSF
jgi:two-component sensor histidine kinase